MSNYYWTNLDDYAEQCHMANKTWWRCLHCNETGTIKVLGILDGLPPGKQYDSITVIITCPECNGTGIKLRNYGELIALMHSELSEGLEGHRKGLMDDKLPQYNMLDVELIDCVIRIFDLLGQRKSPVQDIYEAKMKFNAERADHKIENRVKDGGKKF